MLKKQEQIINDNNLNQKEVEAIATKIAYLFFDFFRNQEDYQVAFSESGFSVEDSPDSELAA
ncbi:hypothetical protein KKB83_00350 [Patescibacteria group bacterium]|nr:hypothetical protein [Patescibacteria group bacterium]